MSQTISVFRDKCVFLSNFFVAPVTYQGLRFANNEAAFQAAKCPSRMNEFCSLDASAAKRLGHRVEHRIDWEEAKLGVMYDVCKAKFTQNPELSQKLLGTGDRKKVLILVPDSYIIPSFIGGKFFLIIFLAAAAKILQKYWPVYV